MFFLIQISFPYSSPLKTKLSWLRVVVAELEFGFHASVDAPHHSNSLLFIVCVFTLQTINMGPQ